jgi:uncharacterized membrane protein
VAEERETTRPLARRDALDTPLEARRTLVPRARVDPERFGRLSEAFARFMGTPRFLFGMSVFVLAWLAWNTFAPESAQFDPRALNYTLLTLILSLQASYAAPLILLAQNRQDDRDRVSLEQDRQRAERNLADTEYLAREVAALRIALGEVATRDFLRSELRALLTELERADEPAGEGAGEREPRPEKRSKKGSKAKGEDAAPPVVEPVAGPAVGMRVEPVVEQRGSRRLELHPDG